MISQITDRIIPNAIEWQNRPLHTGYPVIFIDGVYFNVKNNYAKDFFNTTRIVGNLLCSPIKDDLSFR